MKMIKEHLWSDTDRERSKYSEKNPSQCPWSTTNLTRTDLESKVASPR